MPREAEEGCQGSRLDLGLWVVAEAPCQLHPGLLSVKVAVVASDCSIGIQLASAGPLPATAGAEEVLIDGR